MTRLMKKKTASNKLCVVLPRIVYGVSNRRKLTPKHIGLDPALHQVTRSEALIDMFHVANHPIGIDTFRRFDTSITDNILDMFTKNCYVYVTNNIMKDQMIHCSCDNIDVLEAILDPKNIFHCTQMMVWQRGPSPQQEKL